jgi:Calx-beta domain
LHARRSYATRALLSGIAIAAGTTGLAHDRVGTSAAEPTVTVGSVDVVSPWSGSRTVQIPITLNQAALSSVKVAYVLTPETAVPRHDYEPKAGVLTFSPGQSEREINVTVLSDDASAAGACWYQGGTGCRSFNTVVSIASGSATVANPVSESTIISEGSIGEGIGVGDVLVGIGQSGRARDAFVPVTLTERAAHRVSVDFSVTAINASAGLDFTKTKGTVAFPAGSTTRFVRVTTFDGHGEQPDEVVRIELSDPSGAAVVRSMGTAVLATSAAGVPNPIDPALHGATLTQVVSSKTHVGESYAVTESPGSEVVTGANTILNNNGRMVFWPATQTPTDDQQSCASWSAQDPAQASGIPTQEGVALRVATRDGITRAVTVTKNVYGSDFGVFNVHVWNTDAVTPLTLIKQFNLNQFLVDSDATNLPWNVCARVVGEELQFELWLPGATPPAWGDVSQGGTVELPVGWDYAGNAGMYAGHLGAGASLTYTDEYEGAPTATPTLG